jgi:hypothetical protein
LFRKAIGLRKLVILLPLALLPGCVSTATSLVTAPVRVAAKGVDWATTSQDEADRNLGRKVRKEREQQEKERKRQEKERRKQAERGY